MADFTPNYNLKKPLRTEYYNVADSNGNSDIVDTQLKAVNDRVDLVEGEVDALELGKVDKVVGKQLSDENYTLIEKNKLAGIEENATADMSALEIKTQYESNADTNAYTDAEKAKVANLPADTNAQLAEVAQKTEALDYLPKIFVDDYKPVDASIGDLWFKPRDLKSAIFNGVNSYVSIPSAVNGINSAISNAITFEMEFTCNLLPVGGIQVLAGGQILQTNRYKFLFKVDDTVPMIESYLEAGGTQVVGNISNNVSINTKYHLAMSYDGTTVKVYLNGTLVNSYSLTGNVSDITHFTIGRDNDPMASGTEGSPGRYFNGKIKNIRLWNVARTQSEIQNSVDMSLKGDEIGLIGYWKLNEGEGVTAFDKSVNGNNGTYYNIEWGVW